MDKPAFWAPKPMTKAILLLLQSSICMSDCSTASTITISVRYMVAIKMEKAKMKQHMTMIHADETLYLQNIISIRYRHVRRREHANPWHKNQRRSHRTELKVALFFIIPWNGGPGWNGPWWFFFRHVACSNAAYNHWIKSCQKTSLFILAWKITAVKFLALSLTFLNNFEFIYYSVTRLH